MSEHIQKSDHAARQSRRGGKRLAAGQAERERKCPPTPPEVQPEPVSAPTAVKPLIPEWGEEPAGPSRRTEPRRRRLRQAVQSWQDTEGEISPVVTGCQALAEKAKNTRRHWRRLVREKKAKRFPESERLPVQLLLLAWGMLPTLGGLLGERIRASRKQRRERVSALRAKLGHRWRLHPAMLLCGGCVAAAIGLFFSVYTFGTTVLYDGEVIAAVGSQSAAEEAASDLEAVTARTLGESYTIDDSLLQYSSGLLLRQDVVDETTLEEGVKGCSQVNISREDYIPEYQIDFDREKLAINGLNVTTASMYLRNRVNGSTASKYREDGDEYDIKVRYAPEFRESVEDLENILIYNNEGKGIRIRDLGKVVERMTPPTIERKDRERVITVSAVAGKGAALSDLVAAARNELKQMDIPSDVSWQLGGTFEDQQDTFTDLGILMVLIIILVFIVMAAQFESLVDPFVIMFSIPFAFTGIVLGLAVTQTPLGVMALIGVIMLMGIVVKNGIVLIDYTILCRERGMGIITSVVTAGKSRLRPVLMTTLTTVLGMIPMAVGTGEGSEMWRSMGMTVAWGLSVSTLITLIIVPTVYAVFAANGVKRRRRKIRKALRNN